MPTFGFVIPSFGDFTDPSVFADLVQAGEDLGFADVWFGDHVVVPSYAAKFLSPDWLDPIAACIYGIGRTRRIRFGTDVLVAPYRHPALVAKMVASAERLSPGRFVLGVGVGYLRGEFAILGLDVADRGAMTDEFLEVLHLLWEGEGTLAHAGKHFRFDDAVFGPRPPDPLPVWVGGNGPRALRRAALHGTGWHPLFPTSEGYAAAREQILSQRAAQAPFTFSYSCAVTTLLERPPDDRALGTWDEMADIPDDFSYSPPIPLAGDGRPRFVGTPDVVGDDIEAYVAAGVEHFTLRFANGSPDVGPAELLAQLRWFATDIAPRFARAQS